MEISQSTTKRIGISLRVEHFEKHNEKRNAISQDWLIFLKKINAFPILIPNTLTDVKSFLHEMKIDGFILSGGDNIGDDTERDQTEKEIIDFAVDNKIPILGVCRGMQVINNYFGGSIIITNDKSHVGKNHIVELTNDKVSKILDKNSLEVNSYHNNIIKRDILAKNLETFAITREDKTVEGYFHTELPIIGVMWHPERDTNFQSELDLINILEDKKLWNN